MYQALKDHPHWSLFLLLNLQVPAWSKTALLHRRYNPTFMASWLSLKHSMQHISSTPSHQADSPRSTGVLILGSFCNPHGSSSKLPWTPVDLQPCPRYERLQHGLSMWFSLCSDCHRLVSSLPNSFKCLPHPSGWPWTRGSLPCASAPLSPGKGWSHLLSSFFPLPLCPFFPLSYQVLYGSGYSFSVVSESCQYSPGLLWELLHL